jgi:hypothetical protein
MGYENRALKAACRKCGNVVGWFWKPGETYRNPSSWLCKGCNHWNYIASPPRWPSIPGTLYLGHEQNRQLRLHPVPADRSTPEWVRPYSIRSFLLQASEALGGCSYTGKYRGSVMDEDIFADVCCSLEDANETWRDSWNCHITAGWTNGETSCPLWEQVAKLCQSEPEQKFLHRYLSYTKHRQFPMLLPQARIGIAERRRPDFVAFIPLQYWSHRWIAIQLDGAHPDNQKESDEQRDAYIREQGYDVRSIRPSRSGYLEEVRRLVESFEYLMNTWEEDGWSIAIEAEVSRVEHGDPDLDAEPDDIPF